MLKKDVRVRSKKSVVTVLVLRIRQGAFNLAKKSEKTYL